MPTPPQRGRTPTRRRLALLAPLLLVCTVAHAQEPPGELLATPPPMELEGWAYRWDPPEPSAPGAPLRWHDTRENFWRPTQPGLRLADQGDRTTAWFKVPLPPQRWAGAAVFFSGVDSDFTAYVGGRPVYRSQPTEPSRPPGWPWYLFRLPEGYEGQPLFLHVHSSSPMALGPYRQTMIGTRSDLVQRTLTHDLPTTLIGLVSLAFGVIALFVFLYDRKLRVYLWFGLFVIAEGAVYVSISECMQLVWYAPFFSVAVLWLGRALYPAMFVAFFAESLGDPSRPRVIRAALVAAGVGVGTALLALFSYPLFRMPVFWVLSLEYLGGIVGAVLLSAKSVRRTGRGRGLLVGGLLSFGALFGLTLLSSFGFILLPELTHLGYLILMLGMGSILLRQFASAQGALEEHARALEEKNQKLVEVESTLRDAVKGRDAFLSIASHELRTPLAVIVNHAHLLLRDPRVPAEPREQVETLRREARHLARMVEDLLDVSRISHGKLLLKPEPLNLTEAISDSLATTRALADDKGVALAWTPGAEPLWAMADPTRVDQIVGNLVRNAVKHTQAEGSIQLTLARDGEFALLTVEDTGAGIAPELLPRVFELFVQGEPLREQVEDGLGVGLALVRQLARMHGGDVRARSEGVGQGCALEVRLPLCARPARKEPAERAPGGGAPKAQPSLPIRVLLVEDNRNLRFSLMLALKLQGFEVLEAENGEEGLRKLRTDAPHVALVDIAMPGMNGFSLAEQARAAPGGERLRLVALTGYGQLRDHAQAKASGFDRLLVKPVDPEELGEILRELLGPPARDQVA